MLSSKHRTPQQHVHFAVAASAASAGTAAAATAAVVLVAAVAVVDDERENHNFPCSAICQSSTRLSLLLQFRDIFPQQ